MTEIRSPAQQARDWLDQVAEDLEARFTRADSGAYQAIVHAPHPMAPDVPVRVAFIGGDRPAALAGARSQLRALAERAFADPARAMVKVADAREAHLYTPTVRNVARVSRALIARGHPAPANHEIQRAHLALKIDRGHDDHLVAEIVDELLAQRERMDLVKRSGRMSRQPALL